MMMMMMMMMVMMTSLSRIQGGLGDVGKYAAVHALRRKGVTVSVGVQGCICEKPRS